jgi:non-ribosomal peptide synthetase component F
MLDTTSPRQSRIEDVLPLAPLQEGLLFHALYEPDAADVYTGQLVVDLEGAVDGDRLQRALYALVQRHANLRVCFRHKGEKPVQIVVRDVVIPWVALDFSAEPEHGKEALVSRWRDEDRARRFDVSVAPLIRAALLTLNAGAHRLVLTWHHILLDGWSIPVLMRELLAIYEQGGSTDGLPRVTPYREYLAWIAQQDRDSARQAWTSALDGLEEGTRIAPAQPARQVLEPAHASHELSEELTAAIGALARTHGCTTNTLVQAVWALVLARVTGRTDIVFGAAVSGRPVDIRGIETMVGLFINLIPVRVRVRPWDRFHDILRQLHDQQSALMSYHHLPLTEIQRWAGVSDLFDTALAFENYPVRRPTNHRESEVRVATVQGREATHYAISMAVVPRRRLLFQANYQPDLLSSDVVARMLRSMERLFAAAVADASQPVGTVDLLDAGERAQVLDAWNANTVAASPETVNTLIRVQAARAPDAIAVVDAVQQVSYGTLWARAAAVAAALRAAGVGAEDRVAILLPRQADVVVAMLGVLEAGAAYVPLDPTYPAERLAYLLADARPRVVLLPLGATVPTGDVPVVWFDAAVQTAAGTPAPAVAPGRAAYVMYTSGSSGQPKGATITHGGLTHSTLARGAVYPTSPRAFLLLPSFAFDSSVAGIYWTLVTGGTLVVVADGVQRDVVALRALVAARGVSHLLCVPSL